MIPGKVIYQQADMILKKVDEIPQDAVPVEVERFPDGGIPLGGGHVLYPGRQRPRGRCVTLPNNRLQRTALRAAAEPER